MNSAKMLYKLPQGTERLILEEAFKRQVLTQNVQNLFTSWGYLPVQTPVFDFYDLYASFLGKAAENVYRLVDREGDLLMLRSDITLFLARSMGVTLREGHDPLRVCYTDVILRHQDLEDISANEFFQIGAEFIGSAGPDGDLEILLLLEDVLTLLGLKDAKVNLGSRAVFDSAFSGLDSAIKAAVLESVLLRQNENLEQLLATDQRRNELCKLFSFIGTATEAQHLLEGLPILCKQTPEVIKEATSVVELAKSLEKLGFAERFRVDFSEVGRQSYYTGSVFQVYQEGVGDAVASGGRYDKLLSHFGLDSPSVGFSFHLRKIEHLIDTSGIVSPSQAVKADGKTLEERWKNARNARKSGRIVTL